MQIIKPLLILCFVVLLIAVFRNRSRVGLRAGFRLSAVGLAIAAIVFVVDPNIAQRMAEWVGVARGTDLILYGLVVVFAVTALSLYFMHRETEVRLQLLARRLALSEAVHQSGPPGAPAAPPQSARLPEVQEATGARPDPGVEESRATFPARQDR